MMCHFNCQHLDLEIIALEGLWLNLDLLKQRLDLDLKTWLSLSSLPHCCLINVTSKWGKDSKKYLFHHYVHIFINFLGPSCLTIALTSAYLLHLPSSLSACGYLWPGMCRAGQRARALVMCGCRRPPSPIAPADITDNYSITTVKTRRCHTQSRSAWWKRDGKGVLGRGGSWGG